MTVNVYRPTSASGVQKQLMNPSGQRRPEILTWIEHPWQP